MIDVMVLFGADRRNATKQMEQVYLLEKKIATVFEKFVACMGTEQRWKNLL